MSGQIVELAANVSKGRGKCWGRLYLNLSASFDSILREFLIADSTYDVQQLQSSLKALNISDQMCDQVVREAITERNLIRRTGASAQLGDLVGDMHTATWIVCSNEMPDNDDLVVWTKRGSRQGCPLGRICLQSGKRSCTTRHSHPGTVLKQRHVLLGTLCMTPETGSPPHSLMSRLWMTRVFRSKPTTLCLL